MNTKSIDGLQWRASGGEKKAKGQSRAATSSVMKRRTAKTTPPRRVGLPDKKSEVKEMIKEGEKLEKLKKTKKKRALDEDDNSAVKEFLAEVRDVDPTDLTEVPQEEKAKGWSKKK
jgi:restriction endonuclease Mrr